MIRNELKEYGHDLDSKQSITVVNKIDVTEVREVFEEIKSRLAVSGVEVIGVSSATGEGLDMLLNKITSALEIIPRKSSFEVKSVVKKYNIENLPNRRMVFNKGRVITLNKKL